MPKHVNAVYSVSGIIYYLLCSCFFQTDGQGGEESLGIENTLWAGTVVASGTALGVVVYTGKETRAVMNTSQPKSKVIILPL